MKEHAHILELHLLILRDRMLLLETQKLIKEQNFNAERALYQAFLKIKEVFQRIGDKHIRGRIQDVEAVYRRLLGHLTGRGPSKTFEFPEPVIIVARDLSPAETTQMSSSQVLGFITERGGKTSHTAIIAHSLEIPAVVGLDSATLEIESGDLVIINGLTGRVIIDPDDAMRRSYQVRREEFETFKWEVAQGSALPAVTSDGHPTRVLANIEQPDEVSLAQKYGADGDRALPHRVPLSAPAAIAHGGGAVPALPAGGGGHGPPGGHHPHPGHRGRQISLPLEYAPEMNPALGLRAIRFCLKEQKIFRTQLKAILRASAFGKVRVMFPLISSPRELHDARLLLESVKGELARENHRL